MVLPVLVLVGKHLGHLAVGRVGEDGCLPGRLVDSSNGSSRGGIVQGAILRSCSGLSESSVACGHQDGPVVGRLVRRLIEVAIGLRGFYRKVAQGKRQAVVESVVMQVTRERARLEAFQQVRLRIGKVAVGVFTGNLCDGLADASTVLLVEGKKVHHNPRLDKICCSGLAVRA